MRAQSETFKGIEFVRISSLPNEQKEQIWASFQHDKIIKIVKDQALLNDCILYADYVSWLSQQHVPQQTTRITAPSLPAFAKLVLE